MKPYIKRYKLFKLLSLFTVFAMLSVLLQGAVFEVTTTEDFVEGSLRDAITRANNNFENDTINLPAGVYVLKGTTSEDVNAGGDLDVNNGHKITINGQGAGTTIIDGNKNDRILHILRGAVIISGVTIQNGNAPDGQANYQAGEPGGGIYNTGDLTMTNCIITNNKSGDGYSGHIHWSHVDCSWIGGDGGGIYNTWKLKMSGCSITNNTGGFARKGTTTCGDIPVPGRGGAIFNGDSGNLQLDNCTITNNASGYYVGGGEDHDIHGNGADGGGIYNSGFQELRDCIISFNSTGSGDSGTYPDGAEGRSGHGGGIFNGSGGTSNLYNCGVKSNRTEPRSPGPYQIAPSEGNGGGIYNSGNIFLYECSIDRNFTWNGGSGGGIYHNTGELTLWYCCISNNYTGSGKNDNRAGNGGHGGGLAVNDWCHLTNCTVSNNYTGDGGSTGASWGNNGDGGSGGGIYTRSILYIQSCTIYLNHTGAGGSGGGVSDGVGGDGGGICIPGGRANTSNTIIAGNYVPYGSNGPDGYGVISSWGYNFVENMAQCAFSNVIAGNITGKDPKLGSLADNGGATMTHAPLPGSPVLDAGHSEGITDDQRRFTRPVDLPGVPNIGDGADMGAVELENALTVSGYITSGSEPVPGVVLTFTPGGQTTTNSDGFYSKTVTYKWTGTVIPAKTGFGFSPPRYTYTNITADQTRRDFSAIPSTPPFISLDRTQLNFGADLKGNCSANQEFLISNGGGGFLNFSVTPGSSWISCTPVSGSGSALVSVSVDPSYLNPGTYTGQIVIDAPGASNSPRAVNVTLTVYQSGGANVPFGSFDNPLEGSTVSGGLPVTGWALDNIGLESVKIYRDKLPGETGTLIYVGDAVFINGARPDVETAYPGYPGNYNAGWGYMMLTHGLPDKGNRDYTLHAVAKDKEGNTITLGTKRIICDNASSIKPFGTIDTPRQGEVISGNSYVNFGWALTPQPNTIPKDGSTIKTWIDGKVVGQPVYNQYRKDIATLFPDTNNCNGAVGYFYLDTTSYQNGIHAIQWTVRDDAGNTDGIGSRYFYINNTGNRHENMHSGSSVSVSKYRLPGNNGWRGIPVNDSLPVKVIKGFNRQQRPEEIYADENGVMAINSVPLQPLVIKLDSEENEEKETGKYSGQRATYSGFMTVNNQPRPLPVGSTFDSKTGTFYWQPGAGFAGEFKFIFIKNSTNLDFWRKTIIVRIGTGNTQPDFVSPVDSISKARFLPVPGTPYGLRVHDNRR